MSLFRSGSLGSGKTASRPSAQGPTGGLASGLTSSTMKTTSSLGLRKSTKISDEEFRLLADFIYENMGISIPDKRKYLLENRLGARLTELKLNSFKDYHHYLKFDKNRSLEMDMLCEKITTNETSFYRDVRQLNVFQNDVLKEIIKKQEEAGKKEISIWCAGCSSGEEPYTLAIMLNEVLGMGIIGWRITISAYDLSPAMLKKAKEGLYTDYALRTTPKGIVAKYFDKDGAGYRVKTRIKKLIKFAPINLSNKMALKRVARSQVVFCRNVIIYFDDPMKKQVINSFYDNLLPGGYLFLGHSESIHKLSTAFKPVMKPGGICYQKEA